MDERIQRFERELNQAEEELARARERRRSIEGHVPDEFVEALQELEARLDELDSVAKIDDEDLAAVERTRDRLGLLSELLASLGRHQDDLVEQDLRRQRLWIDILTDLVEQGTVGEQVESDLAAIETKVEDLEKLVSADRHALARTNDRFTPADIERGLRNLDVRIRDRVAENKRHEAYLDGTRTFIDEIHGRLREFRDENPERRAYGDQLEAVKVAQTEAEADADPVVARTAFEGAMMLFDTVSRAICRQAHAVRLADAIAEIELSTTRDPQELAATVQLDALIEMISEVAGKTAVSSGTSRFERLLKEYDGDVPRMLDATEFEADEAFELLRTMYEDDAIDELTVTFDQ